MNENEETKSDADQEETAQVKVPVSGDSKQAIYPFALVTLLALFVSLSSLTIISSRQTALISAEGDMNKLQERITASIFLTLDAQGSNANADTAKTALEKTASGGDSIDPAQIAQLYRALSSEIQITKSQIANGLNQDNSRTGWYDRTSYLFDVYPFKVLPSDMLIGLLLVSCGILGSIMSIMRDGKGRVSKAVILGASVGFVALLGVKGGTTVFIISSSGVNVPFNPYSTAFAGVVAGMFSEKLYLALSKLTDKAFGDDKNRDNANVADIKSRPAD